MQTSYFLGTGPKEYFYTLWRKTVIPAAAGVRGAVYYSYRQNLAHDYAEAVTKATDKTGQSTWEAFDISEYRRQNSSNPDLSLSPEEVIMSFGKYQGQSVAQVEDENLNYLLFLATKSDWEPTQTKHARVLNYIKAMFQPVAEKIETDRAAARAARDAQRADLPAFEGRVTIRGTVISTKAVESQFGTTIKMLVEHQDGWKVWGTIPAGISFINETIEYSDGSKSGWAQRGLERGDVVQFDAKVEKSDRGRSFGFFSRATKPALLSVADGRVDDPKKGEYPHVTRMVIREASAEVEPVGAPAEDYGHVGGNYDAD
jgi:hypothetical protein